MSQSWLVQITWAHSIQFQVFFYFWDISLNSFSCKLCSIVLFVLRVSNYMYTGSSPLYIIHFLSFCYLYLFYFYPLAFLSLFLVSLIIFSFPSILPWALYDLILISKMILSFSLFLYWVVTLISYLLICLFVYLIFLFWV